MLCQNRHSPTRAPHEHFCRNVRPLWRNFGLTAISPTVATPGCALINNASNVEPVCPEPARYTTRGRLPTHADSIDTAPDVSVPVASICASTGRPWRRLEREPLDFEGKDK